MTVRLEPRQAEAVRALARAEQDKTGAALPDVSAVVRRLLDVALAKRPR